MAFPGVPDDALPVRRLTAGNVYPIQITAETGLKPPTTSIVPGTVKAAAVLISARGREPLTTERGNTVT